MASNRRFAGPLLAISILAMPACDRPPQANLLLVSVDTLRADRLGVYGSTAGLTPHLDALAGRGAVFEQLIVPVPRTTQSTASLLTGRHPVSHGARGLFWPLPAGGGTTLAEALHGAGYDTAALVSNLFLRPGQGFERGFDLYDNPPGRWERNGAATTVDDALDWLDRTRSGGKPWFLWVHLLDPHWSYEPDGPFAARAGGVRPEDADLYAGMATGRIPKGEGVFGSLIPEDRVRHLVGLYEGEIAAVDAAAGRLLEGLATRGLAERTLVALTADHGEALGGHGYRFAHGEYLYEDTVRIPGLLSGPGIPPGRRLRRLVRNFDLMPTLLELLAVRPPPGMDGVSRAAEVRGEPEDAREREIYLESDLQFLLSGNPRRFLPGYAGSWRALRGETLKVIRIPTAGAGEWEIYDPAADPDEARNLAGASPPGVADAKTRLAEWERRAALPPGAESGPAVPREEHRMQLQSLGYVDAGRP